MPKRIPLQTIILVRDGKRVVPEIGKAFDFTSDELASIKEVSPDAVRAPVNETPSEPSEPTKTAATGNGKSEGKPAGGAKADAKADTKADAKIGDNESL
jgi:hypothetical protein